ncbi:MAG: hypothetical protein PHD40_08190 [Syntrophomonadaceae bacterium]|nr:hypothetical protein [Syntrophomonadaceae bacterium]
MENREHYQGKMEALRIEWVTELDKLAARADKAKEDTKQGYHDQIEVLRSKHASILSKLQELITSSDDAWGDLKEGRDLSRAQLKDAYTKTIARIN